MRSQGGQRGSLRVTHRPPCLLTTLSPLCPCARHASPRSPPNSFSCFPGSWPESGPGRKEMGPVGDGHRGPASSADSVRAPQGPQGPSGQPRSHGGPAPGHPRRQAAMHTRTYRNMHTHAHIQKHAHTSKQTQGNSRMASASHFLGPRPSASGQLGTRGLPSALKTRATSAAIRKQVGAGSADPPNPGSPGQAHRAGSSGLLAKRRSQAPGSLCPRGVRRPAHS